jgi:hypothetical protein
VARKMCDMHYRRWMKFGNVNATKRPDDWGKRNKHPLWQTWKWTKRAKNGRVTRWDDFYKFLDDVGQRPSDLSKLRRYKSDAPFGPDNFFWSEPIVKSANQTASLEGRAKYMRDWRKANPLRAKHHDLKKTLGIGLDEYTHLLEKQGGKCAICGKADEWFNLAADHCHNKGYVRGLLCSLCNRGLGLYRDDPSLLRRAAEYIEETERLL